MDFKLQISANAKQSIISAAGSPISGLGEVTYIRHYSASRPDVAVKKYLNYLRRYTHERPTQVEIYWTDSKGEHKALAQVEWYHGKLENAILKSDYISEWWKLVGMKVS